ncbi:MAG TPA: response regulator, partial [Gammaproteobacteria bacterium]|nr:response regulator [Gammaproteobacteria bacterium]
LADELSSFVRAMGQNVEPQASTTPVERMPGVHAAQSASSPPCEGASQVEPAEAVERAPKSPLDAVPAAQRNDDDRLLRVTAEHLDDLLQLAGEALVESRRLKQGIDLAQRVYDAALACRMRPFSDGTHGFARMVRDVALELGKQARVEMEGLNTPVDRDVLEHLEAPLGHLLRNALDHGIEPPEERAAQGKPAEGVIRVEARHSAGQLLLIVSDDGGGVPIERLRAAVSARGLSAPETAARLTDAELLEFLFLPGFTLKESVTGISGRGVGLDVVHDALRKLRGSVRITTQAGQGTRFQMQLPLTLSVLRALLVRIADEPYALPLAQVVHTARVARADIEFVEGRPHFLCEGRPIGLASAQRVLKGREVELPQELCVVVLGAAERAYGLVVDGFLNERELVVHKLDPRLGKVQDVAAAALMEDGAPALILDVDDLVHSIEQLAAKGGLRTNVHGAAAASLRRSPKVLVVDDSLTVRELERKLLVNAGYDVEIATDGMDGWNAVRTSRFDLVITDVDMPRMDGIDLVRLIRQDPHLKDTPVMIVSYKDRPEDRRRGLDTGADHYLAKASFHDAALLDAVRDLIGDAEEAQA